MNIIRPIAITDAMVGAGTTVPEDPTPAWVSGTSYLVGNEVHLPSTHRVYRCGVATSSSTPPNTAIANWTDVRPTNRWAAFDVYTSTKTTGTTSLTFVLSPGYFNALALYGVTADSYSIVVKDAPGGTTARPSTGAPA